MMLLALRPILRHASARRALKRELIRTNAFARALRRLLKRHPDW